MTSAQVGERGRNICVGMHISDIAMWIVRRKTVRPSRRRSAGGDHVGGNRLAVLGQPAF